MYGDECGVAVWKEIGRTDIGCDSIFFFKQKTAYEMLRSLVGSEMCIRDRGILDHLHGFLKIPGKVFDFQVLFRITFANLL